MTYVRNLCAHHLRLWNRGFTITPALPISFPSHVVASVERASPASRRIYNTLVLVAYMCGVIEGTNQWRDRVITLIDAWPQGWRTKWVSRTAGKSARCGRLHA
ncbi:MAG: hypothetical protein DME50_14000 [Verrucomicrobia bacterium]|nr:MAG: hypothetical protein DME50_14000 [Verrucomicrobiota bacterium]